MSQPAFPFFLTFFLSPLALFVLNLLQYSSFLNTIFLLITVCFGAVSAIGMIYLLCTYINNWATNQKNANRVTYMVIFYFFLNITTIVGIWHLPTPLFILLNIGAIPSLITALTSYSFIVEITYKNNSRFKYLKWFCITLAIGTLSSALLGAIALFFLDEDIQMILMPAVLGLSCSLISCTILFLVIQIFKSAFPPSLKLP